MIALLKENNLSGNQMCVSLEFYEKGVPIDAIKEIIVRGDNTIAMRSAYSKILENMEQMKKESEKAPEYVESCCLYSQFFLLESWLLLVSIFQYQQ